MFSVMPWDRYRDAGQADERHVCDGSCIANGAECQALVSATARGTSYRVEPGGWKNYGYLAAVEPQYAIAMSCAACKTRWTGCWDAFECPECGRGELPSCALDTEVEGAE